MCEPGPGARPRLSRFPRPSVRVRGVSAPRVWRWFSFLLFLAQLVFAPERVLFQSVRAEKRARQGRPLRQNIQSGEQSYVDSLETSVGPVNPEKLMESFRIRTSCWRWEPRFC